MNKSPVLDDILQFQIKDEFESRINDFFNMDTWNPDNRDSKISSMKKLVNNTSEIAQGIINSFNEKTIDGIPFHQFIVARSLNLIVNEYLQSLRMLMDDMTEEEMKQKGLSYEWMTEQIRANVLEINQMFEKINQAVVDQGYTVEEV